MVYRRRQAISFVILSGWLADCSRQSGHIELTDASEFAKLHDLVTASRPIGKNK